MILHINTAHDPARVVFKKGDTIIASREFPNTPEVGKDLLVAIDGVIQEADITKEDITEIGTHPGPGPYSALRAGEVTAELLRGFRGLQQDSRA